jgi:ribosome-binding protein aMBF1 (putative translation factor)
MARTSSKPNRQADERYNPAPFDPKAHAEKMRKTSPAFREAYDALADEFETLAALLQARHDAGFSQTDIAKCMGVSQPAIARLEGSLGSVLNQANSRMPNGSEAE